MDNLIPIINKLQDLASTTGNLNLNIPQIVVVGEQSSGKSSVLESIIGKPILPRGNGVVTRCPVIIQLNHISDDGEWVTFLHKPDVEFSNFEEARREIDAEVNRRAGNNKEIVSTPISLKIYSKDVINLTIVDLPGLVKNPMGNQPQDIEEQVKLLVFKYISNKNSLILAVCAATNDIATVESIKVAKQMDPKHERTIVVLTKLDLMDRGTDASHVLSGETIRYKLGVVGIVNRSQEDIALNKNINDSIKDEEAFLARKYPQLASTNGTKYLRQKLQKILMEHIRVCLPPLQTTITELIIATRNELDLYNPGDRNKPVDKNNVMLQSINQFCKAFSAAILGKSRDIEQDELSGGAKVNKVFHEVLPAELKLIDPDRDITNKNILTTIENTEGIETSFMLPEKAFRDLVRRQIGRLEQPGLVVAQHINTQILNIVETCMNTTTINRYPALAAAILVEVRDILLTRHQKARKMLKSYVMVQSSFTATQNGQFLQDFNQLMAEGMTSKSMFPDRENLQGAKPAATGNTGAGSTGPSGGGGNTGGGGGAAAPPPKAAPAPLTPSEEKLCKIVRYLVTNYYNIVKDAFQDYCPKAIAHNVIYHMEDNLLQILMERLYKPEKIETLVKESSAIADKRNAALQRLEDLENANKIIGEIRNSNI